MPQLATKYLGLDLSNPLIVASSGLTKSVENIIECENAGAGAVVVKSLFEEVLAQEEVGIQDSTGFHSEAYEYLRSGLALEYGPREYCSLIYDAKKAVNIPVIASINCVTSKWWPSFASQLEGAGADALELNVFTTATNVEQTGTSLESLYYDIIETVKSKIKIPVAIKLGMYFTSLPNLGMELCRRGANGLVLFNRFTEPDIDINKLKLKTTFQFSSRYEIHKPLRWIALLNNKVQGDLCATTGIQKSQDVIKLLLAGANAIELASVFYRNGLGTIKGMLTEIEQWMEEKKFETISDFRGMLCFEKTKDPDYYLRAQFMEKIKGYE
jgi:dihydroorotate dehydrogenase (fumarate)